MLRTLRKLPNLNYTLTFIRRTFLTKDYKCSDAWKNINASPIINNINLDDFYNQLDQNYSSKGAISAIDMDIFANSIKDATHLEELKDLLHKLTLSAETGNMLESTHHATIRNFISFGYIEELLNILKNPLDYGVFLDEYVANILLDELLNQKKIMLAAEVASLVMLQEEYTNEITCNLSKYACFKYVMEYKPPEPSLPEDKTKKVDEKKIRIKFLRNPYFDDHFDIKDTYTLSGKTLAWMSEQINDNLNNNLQLIGWLVYKKYEKLVRLCEIMANTPSFKLYAEVINIFNKEKEKTETETQDTLDKCVSLLLKSKVAEESLEEALNVAIENAINRRHKKDISTQQELFQSWVKIRQEKLEEQIERLDRAKRAQLLEEKQKEMKDEEQKLWFFENEEKIDLQIEEKEKLIDKTVTTKKTSKDTDDNYVPPEILPKRK
ncbi:hypothetical protein K1T71_005006 [Dendrolimus kikuchii]|uniref:Uncharacterized protein n=1 Tax=Dendrolimus kikuchii TaxID=765133 RepID=A0ACC1D5V8_9NEOP|nr:hypothetical protein K1T71_005006 [Dendrolimus kikuchii]